MKKDIGYLQGIPGLIVPKNVNYDSFDAVINKFIDKAPELAKKVEDYHAAKRRDHFIGILESIQLFLQGVYARYLESECQILLRRAKYEYASISTTDVKIFATNLSALSVEMQKAQKYGAPSADAAEDGRSDKEDLSNNFAAIEKLINDGKYELAQLLVTYMDERKPEPILENLPDLVNGKNYEEVEKIAAALKEKHLAAISEFTRIVSPKKILAVDDRPEVLSFINNVLKKHYKMFCATEGKTALTIMETQKPDLFILDIDMPEMDGYELAARIRINPDHKKTPIIFLAGNSSREYIMKAMEVGCNDFIVKPATGDLLLEKAAKYTK